MPALSRSPRRHTLLLRLFVLSISAVCSLLVVASTQAAAPGTVDVYSTATAATNPWGLVAGDSGGNIWYAGEGKSKIGKIVPGANRTATITDYAAVSSSKPKALAVNPLNKSEIWYTMSANIGTAPSPLYGVAKFATGTPGTSTSYTGASAGAEDIVAGPTAAGTLADPQYMWFTIPSTNKIGRINIQGGTPTITEYTLPAGSTTPTSIILGPDNNLWFTAKGSNQLGKLDPSTGTFTMFNATAGSTPTDLTVGYDNKIWFTMTGLDQIGVIDPATATNALPGIVPYQAAANSAPYAISQGPDGLVWFLDTSGNKINSISTSGTITPYTLTGVTGSSNFYGIVYGPDGRLWASNYSQSKIIATVANPPLPPTLSNVPVSPYNGTTTNIGISGVIGATFECSIDNSTWHSCTSGWDAFSSPWSLSTSDGTKNVYVRASTTEGGTSTVTNASWTEDRTPPSAPTLSGAPAAYTNSTSASISFTSEAGATFRCSVDGGAYASCTSPKSLPSLSEGSHSLAVKATDLAGNEGAAATASWIVDTTAPSAPTITATPTDPTNSTSASYSFTGEAGATFTCSINGGAYTSCTSPKSYAGLAEGNRTFAVKQTDQAGNTSSAASYSWTIDTTAPSAPSITAKPTDPTNSTSASFSFTGEAGATFTCSINGGAYASCTSPKSYAGLAEGNRTFAVKQTDQAGNTSAAASYEWTIDTTAPSAPSITAKPSDPTNATSASFEFTGEAGASFECKLDSGVYESCTSAKGYTGLFDGSHTFYVKQTDQSSNTSAAASYTWTVDTTLADPPTLSQPSSPTTSTSVSVTITGAPGATFACKLDDGDYEACASPFQASSLADGVHTLSVTQTIGAGQPSAAESVSWTVDTTAPSAPSIDSEPDLLTKLTGATFEFSGEANASFECKLDSGSYVACASPKEYTGLADGSHTFYVKQTDQAGNTSSAASYTWTVDTTAPSAPTITAKPADPTNSTSASFSFEGESNASFECKLDSGSYVACTSAKEYTDLAEGSHTFYVRQTDEAGNTSSVESYTWLIDTAAPSDPTITATPADPTNATSASFSFTGDEGSSFECKLDSGSYAACTSAKEYTSLSAGSHTFYVKAKDAAGNYSSVASYSWTIDLTDPSAPSITAKPSDPTNATSAAFEFTGEAGASFECKLDDGAYASCTSAKEYTGLSEASHTFYVRQTDAAGNTSSAESYSWTIDLTDPSAPSITAKPSDPTSSTTASFSFTGEAGASFECKLDDGAYASCTSAKGYTGLLDGSHTFYVRQTDAAGNTSSAESYTWTIDTTIPDTTPPAEPTITATPTNPTTSTSASFSFEGDGDTASFECKLDSDNYEACTSAKEYTGLAEGSHTFYVKAKDAVGNASTAASYSWNVDTSAPSAPSITAKPSDPANATSASFEFTGEAGASFECKLDSGSYAACTSAKEYTGLLDGSHTFYVRQTDAAGNVSAAESYSWEIDTSAPSAPSITSSPSNPTNATSASFSFTGETNGVFECKLDDGSYADCTSPQSYTGLSSGTHTVYVRVRDAAGNYSSASSYSWTIDLTAPAAPTITAKPSDPSSSTSASFSFSGEANASFECKLDSGSYEACASPKAYTGLAEGSHSFSVRQTDQAGNVSAAESYTWAVSLAVAPAEPTLTSAPASPSSVSTVAFSLPTGASAECQLDDGAWAPCTSPVTPADLADGEHVLRVRSVQDGLRSSSIEVRWTLDRQAPAAPLVLAGPDLITVFTRATFAFAGEPGANIECQLDDGAWQLCASPLVLQGLAPGTHMLRLRQTDSAGNLSPAGEYSWKIGSGPTGDGGKDERVVTQVPPTVAVDEAPKKNGAPTVTVGCQLQGDLPLDKCQVDLYVDRELIDRRLPGVATASSDRVLIGTADARPEPGSTQQAAVRIRLNAIGRRLLKKQVGGFKATLVTTATPVEGVPLTDTTTTRIAPVRQRVVPSTGMFSYNDQRLSKRGWRFVHQVAGALPKQLKSITCIGHTDSRGTEKHNQRLGRLRAKQVCRALKRNGIRARFVVGSQGEWRPRASNRTKRGRSLNRRVELILRYR